MRWPWNWRRRSKSLDHVQIVMFTRAGCHLCDVAWEMLQAEQSIFGYRLSQESIAGDRQLEELYGEQIPVVVIDGTVRFRGHVNRALLRRTLRSLQSR